MLRPLSANVAETPTPAAITDQGGYVGDHEREAHPKPRLHDRRQLVEAEVAEKQRRAMLDSGVELQSVERSLAFLKKELARLDKAISKHIASGPLEVDEARLRTAPGVGPVLASTLLAELPELGNINRRQVAALAGVAPMNNDSGGTEKRRSTYAGRGALRAVLYMATVACTQHNPVIRAHYAQLKARGKPPKVALVACMRKLLTMLNAMLRDGVDWQSPVMAVEASEVPPKPTLQQLALSLPRCLE